MKDYKTIKHFLKQYLEIILTKSDKGNSTLIMEREEYKTEVNLMLSDNTAYTKLEIDRTSIFQTKDNKLIKKNLKEN